MKVAVTGASGFVGRHVVQALLRHGAEVVSLSREPKTLAAPVDARLLDIAASDTKVFQRIGEPDVLIHLAWGGLPNYAARHHLDYELPMHAAFLGNCVASGLRRLVVAGTCLEYGMQSGELDEGSAAAPTTAYALAKHELHRRLLDLRTCYGFGLGWLRLFYLYGEGQAKTSLYSQLRTAVKSGAEHFDMSAGDQVRDFLPIETAADHLARVALAHGDAGTVNICSGVPTCVFDMVRHWLAEWRADVRLNRGVYPYPDYEPFSFWGSAGKLRALLACP